jgi:hypothetical protein
MLSNMRSTRDPPETGRFAQNYASHVQPDERSRLALVPITVLAVVLVALSVTAVVAVVRAGGGQESQADISNLTADMLPDKADVPTVRGGTWTTQLRNIEKESPTPLKVTPRECVSPVNKGARQIGRAEWTDGKDSHGVTLSAPTTNNNASLRKWVISCSAFDVEGVTTGSVHPLTLRDVPDWAVAYTLMIGKSPHDSSSAGIVGVHRGVVINASYSFDNAPDPTLKDALPKVFDAAVAKLDDV